ncbi:hypothetical protein RHGRI_020865 [Rhododendron griersonianum]|uniref:Uncharacterized protein n=1 Tax=Rhododendron griersonianum TaxID=479676 RepID=A0AAV6JLB4_9ERIC|nr:hypothetical protein RHGRI_020865 [Rhododendron griersonianum]
MGLSDGTSPRKAKHDDSDLETFELESLDHGVRLVESSGLPLWSFIKQMNAKKAQRDTYGEQPATDCGRCGDAVRRAVSVSARET